jgi:thiol-disulfide isomerase/thioredoxin
MPHEIDEKSSRQKTLWIMQIAAAVGIVLLLALIYRLQSLDTPPAPLTLKPFHAPQQLYRKDPPALQWSDANKHVHRLADLTGHIVVASVWTTWCEPCLRELPTLNQLFAKIDDPLFEMIGLNADTDASQQQTALNFWQKENLSFETHFLEKASFTPENIPTNYILDQTGKVVFEEVGAMDWSVPEAEAFIRKLLQAAQPESEPDSQESE